MGRIISETIISLIPRSSVKILEFAVIRDEQLTFCKMTVYQLTVNNRKRGLSHTTVIETVFYKSYFGRWVF